MPRPKWTDEQKQARKDLLAAKKLEKETAALAPAPVVTALALPNQPVAITPTIPTIPTTYAPFNRITDPTVPIKALTESIDSTDVPAPIHERLSAFTHVNTAIPKPRDANRIKDIAWKRYQIAKQIKALQSVDKQLEIEGRELLVTYDCTEPLRFDFLVMKIGHGGGGSTLNRKKLEAAGIAIDILAQCSDPRKAWERFQVEDGTEEKKHKGEGVGEEGE